MLLVKLIATVLGITLIGTGIIGGMLILAAKWQKAHKKTTGQERSLS